MCFSVTESTLTQDYEFCSVWSVLLYGCETWTISKVMKDRLMAVEVWFLRMMLKILWTEKKSNEEVFKEAAVHHTLMKRIRQRQLAFLGYVLRKHGLKNLVVLRRIDERKARGRQRLKYLDSLCDTWKNKVSPTELIRVSEDRLLWQRMVANVVDDGTATWHDMTFKKSIVNFIRTGADMVYW